MADDQENKIKHSTSCNIKCLGRVQYWAFLVKVEVIVVLAKLLSCLEEDSCRCESLFGFQTFDVFFDIQALW